MFFEVKHHTLNQNDKTLAEKLNDIKEPFEIVGTYSCDHFIIALCKKLDVAKVAVDVKVPETPPKKSKRSTK